jgi:hypothetical protein
MKNLVKLLGIIALVAVIGFLMVSCATTKSSELSYATTKNSSGYIITNKSYDNDYYEQTYCNDQEAVAFYEIDGFNYLSWVFFHLDYKLYVVEIENKRYEISIDRIKPLEVGRSEALLIAQNAGFNSYSEYRNYTEEQKKLAKEQKKQQEEQKKQQEKERKLEKVRLRNEIDNNLGVVAIVSIYDAKSNKLNIGNIYRLNDTFFANYIFREPEKNNGAIIPTRYSQKLKSGGYDFGEFNEFHIIGKDMLNLNLTKLDDALRLNTFMNYNVPVRGGFGGYRGYIVKYLGTDQVITQAGLIKVIWVFECIGGNNYID